MRLIKCDICGKVFNPEDIDEYYADFSISEFPHVIDDHSEGESPYVFGNCDDGAFPICSKYHKNRVETTAFDVCYDCAVKIKEFMKSCMEDAK